MNIIERLEPLIARRAGARWIFTKNMNWHRLSWYLRSLFASRIAAQNTDMMGDFFGNALFRRKTRLVPRGVNSERFRPDAAPGTDFRRDLGIPPGAVAAGCVAHLLPVKGHERYTIEVAAHETLYGEMPPATGGARA